MPWYSCLKHINVRKKMLHRYSATKELKRPLIVPTLNDGKIEC